jgi:flagellar protein FliO/FliZ
MDGLILKTIASLVLIIALIFGILYLFKKFVYKDYGIKGMPTNIKVLTHLILQPKKVIYFVKVFDKILVLGVSDNNINLLTEITDLNEIEKFQDGLYKPGLGKKDFFEYLKENMGIKRKI